MGSTRTARKVIAMVGDRPLIRDALRAWMEGDLDAFEQALAPDAELLWYESGAWDCHDRESIMRLLRRRRDQDRPVFQVRIDDLGEDTLVASALRPEERAAQGEPGAATLVTIRDGKIAVMRQYRTRDEALAATA